MMSKTLASLKHVGVCYRKRKSFKAQKSTMHWALEDVSLDVHQGDFIGIHGHNGAGKSTLLRILAGTIAPDLGSVIIAPKCHTSLLTLQPSFNPYLSGFDNAILRALYIGVRKKYIESKMKDIMDLSGLGHRIYDQVHSYSSGMTVRLGFAISYFCSPNLLLIDEMLSVSDIEFKQKSISLLQELVHLGKSVVIVSHDSKMLTELTSKIYTLKKGILY